MYWIFLLKVSLENIKLFFQHKKQRIGKINPGEKVFISGYIDHNNAKLYSPVTQKRCAAWETSVYTPRGKTREILLNIYSNEDIIITDNVDNVTIIIDTEPVFNMFLGKVVNSALQLNQQPSFIDYQNVLSEFRHQITLDFLAEYNFTKFNHLGLRRQLTVVEKTLVPGDKLFAWGEVIMSGNRKTIQAKFASDNLITQISMTIVFFMMGLIFSLIGLGMCKEVFL